jgi:hypothetical protein
LNARQNKEREKTTLTTNMFYEKMTNGKKLGQKSMLIQTLSMRKLNSLVDVKPISRCDFMAQRLIGMMQYKKTLC